MASFSTPIEPFFTRSVISVPPSASLREAHLLLGANDISCVAVVDNDKLVGVVSRTDLLRLGQQAQSADADLLSFPDQRVSEHMTSEPVTAPLSRTISDAATTMLERRIHRVFVTEEGRLAGVFSSRDVMSAIAAKGTKTPISEAMSFPLFFVNADDSLALAAERLVKARVTGLLVVDDEWPVGSFGQREALESKHLPGTRPVEDAMNPALVCLPETTRISRAARQASAMRVRRVVAVRHRDAVGILSGMDFVRFAARN